MWCKKQKAFVIGSAARTYTVLDLLEMWAGQPIPRGIMRAVKQLNKRREDSYAETPISDAVIPAPEGRSYLPYQVAGIQLMDKYKTCLLGDDQGLGKTVQICGLMNLIRPRKTLIICPASLKDNWREELNSWSISKLKIDVVQGRAHQYCDSDVIIINYDILTAHKAALNAMDFDLIAIDECQYLQNHEAARTQAALGPGGIVRKAPRVVAMSGTAMSNRPIELWAIMATLFRKYTPEDFINIHKFALQFCDGFLESVTTYDRAKGRVVTKKVMNSRGASNLTMLNGLLRERFMIRRTKAQVLPQLPPKVYHIVDISASSAQKKILKKENQYKEAVVASIETGKRLPELEELSSVRKEIAMLKVDFSVEYIKNILDNQKKVIVFCHHSDVVQALHDQLAEFGVSVITGKVPAHKRQDEVERFQHGDNRVFIGNLRAAGTGLTLTAASEVIFVECSWVPAENEQAVDRAHRISQNNQVSAHFLVWYGSLDAMILRTSIRKQRNIDKVMK